MRSKARSINSRMKNLSACHRWSSRTDNTATASKISKSESVLTLRRFARLADFLLNIFSNSPFDLSLKWSEPSQDSRASKSPACRSVAPQAPPWWPRPRPGQLPTGGSHRPSLMPRFKCKFPGHRAPTAGADDYIRIAKRRRRRQHWWCLSLQGSKQTCHSTNLCQHSPSSKNLERDIWQTNVTQEKTGQFEVLR